MSGVNKVIITGALSRDPEVQYLQSGTAICTLNIPTKEVWYDKVSGEKKESTEWHRIKFFSKQAETLGKHTKKGSWLYIEGRLQTTQYEKDGITRYSTDIIGKEFKFIGNNQSSNQQGQQPNAQQNWQASQSGGYQQQGNYQQPSQPQGQPSFQGPYQDNEPF